MVRHEIHQAYVVGVPVKGRFSGWALAAMGIAGLLTVPILAVLSSFMTPAGEVWRHLWRTQLVELITNTVLLLAGVGSGTLVVGTGLAWLVVYHRFPGRAFFEWALILPLAIPAYVLGFVFLGLFDFAGPLQTFLRATFGQGFRLPNLRSYGGVTLMMTLVFYPYVYLLARAAFRSQGAATLEMARSLGRSPLRAFLMVTLPIARPALAAGVALAMMEALADFGTVATFGYRTLTEAIYRVWYGMFDRTAATQLASGLLCFALGLLSTLLLNTLYLAGLATGLACLLAVVLAYASRLHPSPSIQWSAQCAALGYALPGSVIAVGVLLPLAWLDHTAVVWLERVLGHSGGLLLTGSAVGLLFAYLVRFLAVSLQTVDASLTKIPPSLDDAARSLGANGSRVLRRVHLPLMRRGLLTALILVFVEVMKEMPATLLLRPFGLNTLAVEVWKRTSEAMWQEAALPALAIVAAGILPVLLAVRLSAKS